MYGCMKYKLPWWQIDFCMVVCAVTSVGFFLGMYVLTAINSPPVLSSLVWMLCGCVSVCLWMCWCAFFMCQMWCESIYPLHAATCMSVNNFFFQLLQWNTPQTILKSVHFMNCFKWCVIGKSDIISFLFVVPLSGYKLCNEVSRVSESLATLKNAE